MELCSDADSSVNYLIMDRNLKLEENAQSDTTSFTETNISIKELVCENGTIFESTETDSNNLVDSAIIPDKSIEKGKTSSCEEIVSEFEMIESVEVAESSAHIMELDSDVNSNVNYLKMDRILKLDENAQSDTTCFTETKNLMKEPVCENGKIESTETVSNSIVDSAISPDKSVENGKTSSCEEIISEFEMLESVKEVAKSSACFPINGSESKKNEEASLNTSTNYRCGNSDSFTSDDDEDSKSSKSTSSSDLDEIFGTTCVRSAPRVFPVKTSGELELKDLPPVVEENISVSEDDLVQIGVIKSIVNQVVIVNSFETTMPVNLDTVLFLSPDKPLGRVHDVLGSVYKPLYSIRFNSNKDIREKGIEPGSHVFYAPKNSDITFFVFISELKGQKGSDASWENNNEPPEECIDYSDDEKERAAKKNRSQQKFKRKINDAASATNDDVVIISPPAQYQPVESAAVMRENLKRKQPTIRGESAFHHSRDNNHIRPSTSRYNSNNNFQYSQRSVSPQQPIIHAAHFSVQQRPLRSLMPQSSYPSAPLTPPSYPSTSLTPPSYPSTSWAPSSYPSAPLPVNTPPSFPPSQFPVHQPNVFQRSPQQPNGFQRSPQQPNGFQRSPQQPNVFQRSPQTPIHLLATYHTPMFGQIPAIVPVSSPLHPVAVHSPLLNNVPTLIPAQPLPPNPEHFPQRISQSLSSALQNPYPPNSYLQRPPLYITGNLPPNAPLSVQIPHSLSSPQTPINSFEHPTFPRPRFPQQDYSQPQWPQSHPNQTRNGAGYSRFR